MIASLVVRALAVIGALGFLGGEARAAVEGCPGCAKAAVVDFDSIESCQSFSGQWGGVISCGGAHWRPFRAMLESAIASTRKMQVVERNQLDRVLNEQAVQSWFRTAGRVWSFGATGADYLVYGNITQLGFRRNELSEGSVRQEGLTGTFGIDVKFVETRTGKVFYASSVNVEESLASSLESGDGNASSTSSLGELYGALQRRAARAIAQRLVTEAFPIRILRVSGNSAILSYGAGVLEKGARLEVYDGTAGDLVDPDTGRKIKGAGAVIGTLVVTNVNADFAVATLASGGSVSLAAGARVSLVDPESGPDDRIPRGTFPDN